MTASFTLAPDYFGGWGWGQRDPDAPYLHGGTDPEFSSCTDLALRRTVLIWDVNRYYRDLGIEAPFLPSRPEIRRAFREGARGPRETFCFKQLMNSDTRKRYDAAPWGSKFMDEFVWQEQKERVLAEMLKRRMDVEDKDLVKRVFTTLGIPVETPDTPENGKTTDILDNDSKEDKDTDEPSKAPAIYAFAYYLWKTTERQQDRTLLALWQPLVIRALSDLGVTMRVSLGLMGRTPHEWSTGTVGRRTVAYLNRSTEPSGEVAAKVAAALADHHRTT